MTTPAPDHQFSHLIEGPKHWPHGRQVQVGWLGATGAFYPWDHQPTRTEEPGSYTPVFIDEDDGPKPLPPRREPRPPWGDWAETLPNVQVPAAIKRAVRLARIGGLLTIVLFLSGIWFTDWRLLATALIPLSAAMAGGIQINALLWRARRNRDRRIPS